MRTEEDLVRQMRRIRSILERKLKDARYAEYLQTSPEGEKILTEKGLDDLARQIQERVNNELAQRQYAATKKLMSRWYDLRTKALPAPEQVSAPYTEMPKKAAEVIKPSGKWTGTMPLSMWKPELDAMAKRLNAGVPLPEVLKERESYRQGYRALLQKLRDEGYEFHSSYEAPLEATTIAPQNVESYINDLRKRGASEETIRKARERLMQAPKYSTLSMEEVRRRLKPEQKGVPFDIAAASEQERKQLLLRMMKGEDIKSLSEGRVRIAHPKEREIVEMARGKLDDILKMSEKPEGKLTAVVVNDRKLGVTRAIPLDEFMKVKDETISRAESAVHVGMKEQFGRISKEAREKLASGERILRYDPDVPVRAEVLEEVKTSTRAKKLLELMKGEGISVEMIEAGRKAAKPYKGVRTGPKIEYPGKIYGPPGEPGKWSNVTYIRVHAARKAEIGSFTQWWKSLKPEEKIWWDMNAMKAAKQHKTLIADFLKKKKLSKFSGRAWAELLTHADAETSGKLARSSFAKDAFEKITSEVATGKLRLPRKALLALAGVAAGLGIVLGTREAQAGKVETIGKGIAATLLREQLKKQYDAVYPGFKPTDWDRDYPELTPEEREQRRREELALIRVAGKNRALDNFIRSVFSAWIGERFVKDIYGDFDPSIAGKIVGEIPLWLIGGKLISTVIKGPAFAAKLARSVGTGMIGRAVPEVIQAIHGDRTPTEAMLSTLEEGVIWGALDAVMHPLGGAAKYFLGLGKWNPKIPVTDEIVEAVNRSWFTRMMAWYPEKIGAPLHNWMVAQFRRIPGFEKLLIPPLRRLNNPEVRRSFEDTIGNLNIHADEAYKLMERAQMGLKWSEKKFALEAYRAVEMVKANGEKRLWPQIKDEIEPIAKEHGIDMNRAAQIVHNHLQPIRRAFWGVGKEAVALNMLKNATFIEQTTYIPKKYWWHELTKFVEEMPMNPYKPVPRKLRLQLNNFLKRRNIPPELAKRLEPIMDISYLTWKGLNDIWKDVEYAKLFRKLWLMPDAFSYASRKVEYGTVAKKAVGPKFFEKHIELPVVDTPITIRNEQWLRDNGWVRLSTEKKGKYRVFGALGGGWVPREIAEELKEMMRAPSRVERVFSKLMARWKYGKVILRPATHFRNLMSNLILNDLGGLPFYRMDRYREAARALRQKGDNVYYRKAMANNLLQASTYVRREIGGYYRPGRGGMEKFLQKLSRSNSERLIDNWHTLRTRMSKVMRKPSEVYDMEEKIFKMAKFIDNMKKGMPERLAAEDAMKWTFNYGEITPFIRGVRTWAMPFVTFSYKALPIVFETAIKHPIRFAKWPLMFIGMTYAALNNMNITADDWEYIKRILPKYMRTGHFALIPWKDEKGRLQLADLTYVLPWGDIGELAQEGHLRLMQNPVFQTLSQLASNKNFFGQNIWYEWEEPKVKVFKVFNHIWRQMMPSWTPDLAIGQDPSLVGGFDWYNLLRAVKQADQDAPTRAQFALSQFGLKMRPVDVPRVAMKKYRRKRYALQEARAYYKRLARKNPDMLEKIAEARIKALRDIRQDVEGERAWRTGAMVLNPLALTPKP